MNPPKIYTYLTRVCLVVLMFVTQSENDHLLANTETKRISNNLSVNLKLLNDHLRWGTNLDSAKLLSQQAKALIDDNFLDSKLPLDQLLIIDYHLLEGKRQEYMSNLMGAVQNHEKAFKLAVQLENELKQASALYRLSFYYRWMTDQKQVNRILNLVKPFSLSENDQVSGIAWLSIGDYYHHIAENDSALIYYTKALDVVKTLDDKSWVIDAYQGIGGIYEDNGQPELAIQNYNKAMRIAQKNNYGFEMLNILINKEITYSMLEMVDQQLEMLKTAEKLCETVQDLKNEARIYNGLASVYGKKGDYESALLYTKKSLEMVEAFNMGNEAKSILYSKMGRAYQKMDSVSKAIHYLELSLSINQNNSRSKFQAHALVNLGYAYLADEQYSKSMVYALKGYDEAKNSTNVRIQERSNHLLYQLYRYQNNYEKALEHHEQTSLFKDSLFNTNLRNKLAEQAFNFNVEQHQKELELAQNKMALTEKDQQLKQQTIITLVVLLFLIAISGTAIYTNLRLKHKKTIQNNQLFKKELEFLRYTINNQLEEKSKSKTGFVVNGAINSWIQNPLSKRELDVLSELAKGQSNKQIGEALFISENTVRSHLSKIYEKLEVENRIQAIQIIDNYHGSAKTSKS